MRNLIDDFTSIGLERHILLLFLWLSCHSWLFGCRNGMFCSSTCPNGGSFSWCAFVRKIWNIDSASRHTRHCGGFPRRLTLLALSLMIRQIHIRLAFGQKILLRRQINTSVQCIHKTAPHCPTELYLRTQNKYIFDTVGDHLMNFGGKVVFFRKL